MLTRGNRCWPSTCVTAAQGFDVRWSSSGDRGITARINRPPVQSLAPDDVPCSAAINTSHESSQKNTDRNYWRDRRSRHSDVSYKNINAHLSMLFTRDASFLMRFDPCCFGLIRV